MESMYENLMLHRELQHITLEYYIAPIQLKPLILDDMLLIQSAIDLLHESD